MSENKLKLVLNNADGDSVELLLHGMIGDGEAYCDARSLGAELRKYPRAAVVLRVNSGGGSFFDGLTIYNTLRRHSGPTLAVVEGLAASAATVCCLGCNRVEIQQAAIWHVHESLTSVAGGHAAEFRDTLRWLEKANDLLALVYSLKTRKPKPEIREMLIGPDGDGTLFTAAEAVEFGFCDGLVEQSAKPKPIGMRSEKRSAADTSAWRKRAEARLRQLAKNPLRGHRLNQARQRIAELSAWEHPKAARLAAGSR